MTKPIRILLQTTIPFAEDDWHIGRFSLLRDELSSMKDEAGNQLCEVTTRNREEMRLVMTRYWAGSIKRIRKERDLIAPPSTGDCL